MRNNFNYDRNNQKKIENFFNKKTGTKNNNINNSNYNYNKAKQENNRLKIELNQKNNILKDYNARIEILKEELNQLQKQKNSKNKNNNKTHLNTIANNDVIRTRGKSNNINNRINYNYYDPFDNIINNGLANMLFDDVMPNRNIQRINPNFNPGDYEDYYQDKNINNLINTHSNNFGNYNEESKIEQDIIDQLYPDPDKMTYEQLLELEENVGSVSKGLTKAQIKKIPKIIYYSYKFKNDDNKCVVCQYEFKNGEEVTQLNCGHLFHSDCVDTWLSKNKVCPMCHKEITIK